jgi:hypothetical protein
MNHTLEVSVVLVLMLGVVMEGSARRCGEKERDLTLPSPGVPGEGEEGARRYSVAM